MKMYLKILSAKYIRHFVQRAFNMLECIEDMKMNCSLWYSGLIFFMHWDLFRYQYFACNSNSMKISPSCNSITADPVPTNFCTYHDSTAVMSCAKFLSDHFIRIEVRVKKSIIDKMLVKWALVPRLYHQCVCRCPSAPDSARSLADTWMTRERYICFSLNSFPPGQNGCHFYRRRFQMHFPHWKC